MIQDEGCRIQDGGGRLLGLMLFGASTPNAQVCADGYDQEYYFDDVQTVLGDKRVGQGCPRQEKKADER